MRKLFLVSALMLAGCGGAGIMPGPIGPQGPKGDPGTSCSVAVVQPNDAAPNGGSLISCADNTSSLILNGAPGSNGTNGINGTNGTNGSNGTNGINGTNGTNGTVVAPIQFCPGTGSYPSTFPEVGFCINNNIYAVYSANGGFLTEILPGTWSSNAIGSSCSFTVLPNCQVQ